MANVLVSQSMNLPIPVVGTDTGPDWATNLNACLSIIDIHNHAAGSGVQITPAGIDISTDLAINNNNLTLIRSSRFYIQPSVLTGANDVGCAYVVNGDLYYNDASGGQIQITQAGGVAGSPGTIANLTSPASATYVSSSQTFVWQSAASTPANLDAGFLILRNNSASSNGLTLLPPNAMGASFSITLPALPASQKIVTLDASGNMAAPYTVDGTTIAIASNVLGVPAAAITTTQLANSSVTTPIIANGAVTPAKRSALGQQISSAVSVSTTSTTYTATGLSVTITTTGRPVFVGMIPSTVLNAGCSIQSVCAVADNNGSYIAIVNGSGVIGEAYIGNAVATGNTAVTILPPASISTVDVVGAGTYTYTIQYRSDGSTGNTISTRIISCRLIAYEL